MGRALRIDIGDEIYHVLNRANARIAIFEKEKTVPDTISAPFQTPFQQKSMEKKVCKWYDVCPMKRFYKEGKLDKKWIENYCFRGGKNCKRYEMEEKGIPHPDCMLPNGEIDEELKKYV